MGPVSRFFTVIGPFFLCHAAAHHKQSGTRQVSHAHVVLPEYLLPLGSVCPPQYTHPRCIDLLLGALLRRHAISSSTVHLVLWCTLERRRECHGSLAKSLNLYVVWLRPLCLSFSEMALRKAANSC